MPLSIAMDGPVGAGKSSIADAVAERLGILHLDTGAMYRAAAVHCLDCGVDIDDREAVEKLVNGLVVDVTFEEGHQLTFADGRDVTRRLRTEATSMAASKIATYPGVRRAMVRAQQALAKTQSMLVDGRDICTVVLPNASVKIFLTASDTVRAQRRYLQLQEKGEQADFAEVLEDLRRRDRQDMERETDPLRIAEDAVVVDTSDMNFEESVEAVLKVVEAAK